MTFANPFTRATAFAIFTFAIILSPVVTSPVQESPQPLPIVISSGTPFYPILARQAHITGAVRLRLTTDGKQVSDVQVLSGPAMLAVAASENVKTWRFRPTTPTSFETTFRYTFSDEADCEIDNGSVTLHLPTEVEMVVKRLQTCDPVIDLTKPAVVNLTIKLNNKVLPPPAQLTLTVGDRSMQIPIQNGKFAAPPEVLQAEKVALSMVIGKDQIQIGYIYGGKFTANIWTLMLADKRFPDGYSREMSPSDVRSACALVFESEYWEGTVLSQTNCRSKIKK